MAEVYQCRACGGNVIPAPDGKTGICEYCGKKIVFPRKGYKLMNQANALRARMEFEQAEALYQSLALLNPDDPEIWWSILLCRYGILYVQEANRRVITVNRMKYDSVFDQEAYKKAIALADDAQRRIYEEEARTIQDIQDRLLAAAAKEEKYDIFISFKDKDADGKRTEDSALAQDIYEALTDEGYRVFFSRITLRTALGEEFEPKIFSALQSARMMILVATSVEHVEADWVKNEWSRYLKLMEQDAGKYLLPVYTIGVKPEQLPAMLSGLEGIQANGEEYRKLLLDNVAGRLGRKKKEAAASQVAATEEAKRLNMEESNRLLQRALQSLQDQNYHQAEAYFEQMLDMNLECAIAWWGVLTAETENFRKKGDFRADPRLKRYYDEAMRLATGVEKDAFLKDMARYEEMQRGFRYAECYEKFDKLTKHKTLVYTSNNDKKYQEVLKVEQECLALVTEGPRRAELKKEFDRYNQMRDCVSALKKDYNAEEKKNESYGTNVKQWEVECKSIKARRANARDTYRIRLASCLAVFFLFYGSAAVFSIIYVFFTANVDEIISQSMDWGGVIGAAIMIMPGIFFVRRVIRRLKARKAACEGRSVREERRYCSELKQKVKQEKKEASARAEQLPDIYATLQQKYADVKDFIFPQDLEQHIRDWQRKLREC